MKDVPLPTILVIGKNGQIGWELCRTCATLGNIVAMDYPEIDLASPDSIRTMIREVRPAIIINAAAYTAVDKAESEPEKAMAINGIAPGVMAEEAKRIGALLIHYSTDYVYDGTKREPYLETDAPNPLNVYGRTKLAGDLAIQAVGTPHLILRTSWVYGWRGQNFLMTILKLARERDVLRVVDDQHGAPTWSRYIAEATAQIITQVRAKSDDWIDSNAGIYYLSCAGETTWFGFARAILDADPARHEQKVQSLDAITTVDYPTPARRPVWSLLNGTLLQEAFGVRLPEWRHPLHLWNAGRGAITA
jgi:dTDP-4-dehydrorhamnose reductase